MIFMTNVAIHGIKMVSCELLLTLSSIILYRLEVTTHCFPCADAMETWYNVLIQCCWNHRQHPWKYGVNRIGIQTLHTNIVHRQ
jgi:hypothetical protein